MTEEEWLRCDDPDTMLTFLQGRAGDRKLRLFACACCRQVWRYIRRSESRNAVAASEEFADGELTSIQLGWDAGRAAEAASLLAFEAGVSMRMAKWAERDAAQAAAAVPRNPVAPARVAALARAVITATPDKPHDQAGLLRDVFGNPFRPVPLDPAWLTSDVAALAAGIYEDRAFDRLPVLADALMDAGCDNGDILGHCRGSGPHVRGCWVIDLLLGKS